MKGKVTKTGYKKNSPDVGNDYNIIPSGRITMKDVQFPVYGVDEYGNAQMMYPGGEYQFPGSTVFELPMAQLGGMRRSKVDRILNENRDLNFVQRMYQPGTPSIMIPGQDGPSTHFMESADGFVYPTVVQMPDGNLQYLGEGAYDHAMQTGEYIQFPNDRQARRFAKSYKKGTNVLKEYQTAGQYNGDWRHVGNYGYTAPQDATYVAPPVPKTVIDQADVNRQAARQPTISQYEPPSTTEYVLNKLANPMTTLGYVVRGQDVPDMVPDKGNSFDYAFDVINPAAWLDYGNKSINALSQGDFMGASLNALATLPAVPAIKAVTPAIKTGVNAAPKYLNPNYFKPNSNMMYRGIGREGMQDALESGVFRPKPHDMIPAYNLELGSLGKIDMAKRFNSIYYSPNFSVADRYGAGYIAEVPRDAAKFTRRYPGSDWSMMTKDQIPVSQGRLLEKNWWAGYKPVNISKTTSSVEYTVPTLNQHNAQMRAFAEEQVQPFIDNSYILDRYTPRTMSQSFGDLENFPLKSVKTQKDPIPLLPKSHGYNPVLQEQRQGGEMIKRADGSYSRRGLWDNIRANKGSGRKPTKEMLEQERKIRKAQVGVETEADTGMLITPSDVSSLTPIRKYYEQWHASPRYNEMLRNSTNAIEPVEITKKLTSADKVGRFIRKTTPHIAKWYLGNDWPEIKESLFENKRKDFYDENNVTFNPGLSYTSISEGRKRNLNLTPNTILPLAQEYIDTGVAGYSTSSNGQIEANPAYYINPTSWDADFYHNELLPHELSHSTDRPLNSKRLIPQADIEQIKSRINPDANPYTIGFWETYGDTPREGAINYFTNPTEVRARLNETRYNLNKAGVDIFNNPVTQENLDQLNTRKGLNELQGVYRDEDILWLINNISKKDLSKESNYAQTGGQYTGDWRQVNNYGYTEPQDNTYVPVPKLGQVQAAPVESSPANEEIDIDFDTLRRGVAHVESGDGKYMWNPQSTATGLYGQLFSQINGTNIYGGTRKDFSNDIDAQNRVFQARFDGDLPGQKTGLRQDALDLYRDYHDIITKHNIQPVELAALSNFLGRQGTRNYLGYHLRDGQPLAQVFPNLYGSNVKQANKTPEEYLAKFREVAYQQEALGGSVEYPSYDDEPSFDVAWLKARKQLGKGKQFMYGGNLRSTTTYSGY